MKQKLYVKRNSSLARMACRWMRSRAVALVWGRTIHIFGAEPEDFFRNKAWLAHELVHVKQYEGKGTSRFLASYLWEWMKHGYRNNRYEKEARDVSNHMNDTTIFEKYTFEIK